MLTCAEITVGFAHIVGKEEKLSKPSESVLWVPHVLFPILTTNLLAICVHTGSDVSDFTKEEND